MLKGQVFKEQIFENQIFAVFINTFLAGKNGIINGYRDSMEVTAGTDTVTIQSGAVCIQGRFLEEDTETTLPVGTDTAYCSLVVEINLDNVNTESDFTQGYYKIIKNALSYPTLRQDNIVNTNSGIYQYEIARFKTSLNGISDFIDLRNYIDYESLYKEIQRKLNDVEDGSIYVLQSQFEEIQQKVKNIYPIGSIYLSMVSTNPSEYFGGTWAQISQGRVLVGVNTNDLDFASANLQGGEKRHTLTQAELPNYNLPVYDPGHYHYVGMSNGSKPAITGGDTPINATDRIGTEVSKTGVSVLSGGGNQSHNVMQPYLTCYIWQRTA